MILFIFFSHKPYFVFRQTSCFCQEKTRPSKQPMNLHAASRVSMLNDSTWNQWWCCFFPERTELPKERGTYKSDTKVTLLVLPERGKKRNPAKLLLTIAKLG